MRSSDVVAAAVGPVTASPLVAVGIEPTSSPTAFDWER